MASKKQYKKITFSLRSLGHLIRISGRETKSNFSEMLKDIKEIGQGKYDNLDNFENTVKDLIDSLEKIKRFARRLEFKESNTLRDVVHIALVNHVFSLIDKGVSRDAKAKLEEIVKDLSSALKDEVKNERRLLKGMTPRGGLWKSLLSSKKRISKQEIKEGRMLDHLANEEEGVYSQLVAAINYLAANKGKITAKESSQIGNLLVRFVSLVEEEFEVLFEVNLNAEVQESSIEKELDELEKIDNDKVKEVVKRLHDKYSKLITADLKEAKIMRREEKGIIADLDVGKVENAAEKRREDFMKAAHKFYEMNIKRLLIQIANGADVNLQEENGMTALMFAVRAGDVSVVKLLLDAGADVNLHNRDNMTALRYAVNKGDVSVVKLLLDAGADVNLQDRHVKTALMYAVRAGDVSVVKLLLDAGADVNLQNNLLGETGMTALLSAVNEGAVPVVKFLLDAGADVNLQDGYGRTALMFAVNKGAVSVVNLLLGAGADVNLQDGNGETALMYAVNKGKVSVVNLLLGAGADVNLQEDNGMTALMFAVNKGDVSVVKLLLDAGADPNIREIVSRTALDLTKDEEIKELLSEAMNK